MTTTNNRDAHPATCIACGSTNIDRDRGWVRNWDGGPTYFQCNRCIERRISYTWSPGGLLESSRWYEAEVGRWHERRYDAYGIIVSDILEPPEQPSPEELHMLRRVAAAAERLLRYEYPSSGYDAHPTRLGAAYWRQLAIQLEGLRRQRKVPYGYLAADGDYGPAGYWEPK